MLRTTFLILSIGLCISWVRSQEVSFEIATWYGFKEAAVCYTFDDGCANQFNKARPLFDTAGFPMTLFTVTNWASNWPVLKAMADHGHEIASHTVSHPNFGQINALQQDNELANAKVIIEQKTGYPCLTHAYPYCVKAIDSIVRKYYIAARGCQGYIEKPTPDDYFNISSIIVGNLGAIKNYTDFKRYFQQAAKQQGWLVLLIHGIDNDGGYSPIPSSELRKSLLYLNPRTAKYWVTTFKAATLYSRERNAATLTILSADDDRFSLNVTDSLPDSIYNQPLTLRCVLPSTWPSAVVKQNQQVVFSRIVQRDTAVFVEFDIIPDAGEIVVMKDHTPVVPEIDSIPPDNQDFNTAVEQPMERLLKVIVKKDRLVVSWPASENQRFWQISVTDSLGRIVLSRNLYSGNAIDLPVKLKPGMYFVRVKSSGKIYQTKLIL